MELNAFRVFTDWFDRDCREVTHEHVDHRIDGPDRFVMVAELVRFSAGSRHEAWLLLEFPDSIRGNSVVVKTIGIE